jgi:hypothetical protein
VLPISGQKGEECFVLEVNLRFCRTKVGNCISAERNIVIAVLVLFRILEALCIGRLRYSCLLTLLLLLSPMGSSAQAVPDVDSPAFATVPELSTGFDLLYELRFADARETFAKWESRNPDQPFGEAAVAASYLFEELYRQNVLSSDFFLNEKKFLNGIDGRPNRERMGHFREALARTRQLARERQKANPNDGEALLALTLAAGMESDALSILEKKHFEGLKRIKEADGYAKQLLAHYPDVADAYIAPGIANYVIGSQSAGSRFALWFGGIHGDKKLGMEQIAKTAQGGRYLRPFAKILLALAARRENQNALAQKSLLELKEQYPDNRLFASEYAKAKGLPMPASAVPVVRPDSLD